MPLDVVTYSLLMQLTARRKVYPVVDKVYAFVDLAELGVARWGAGSFIYKGRFYVVGGYTRNGITSSIEYLDLASLSRVYPAYLPTPLAHFAYGFINNVFYIAGGIDSGLTPRKEVYAYDPSSNQVVQKTSLPKGVAYASGVVFNNKLYIIGGIDDAGNILNTTYVYDPSSNTVSTSASMNVARAGLACSELGGKIYCMGGDNGSDPMSVIEVYDPSSNKWTQLSVTLPQAMTGVSAVKVNLLGKDYIVLVGG